MPIMTLGFASGLPAASPVPAPKFTSLLKFVNRDEFDALPLKAMPRITEQKDNNLATFPRGWTRGIIMCNAGGVTNGKQTTMYHFYDLLSPEINIGRLAGHIRKLREENPNLRALLVGGQQNVESVRLGQKLQEYFNDENIPFSMFWGHNHNTRSDIAYDVVDDTWHINTYEAYKGPDYPGDVFTPGKPHPEALREAFSHIKVDPGDTVEIHGQPYEPSELNQNGKQKAES